MMHDDKAQEPAWLRGVDAEAISIWELPEVGGEHTVALERKRPDPALEEAISVIEEEVVAERVTLAELERIHEEARQEGMQLGREEGRAQGLEEGRAQGIEEGLAQGRAQVQSAVAGLKAMVEQLDAPLDQQALELEGHLVDMVIQLARAVVGAELISRPEILRENVRQALARLPKGSGAPVLRVNPEDVGVLSPLLEANPEWQLLPDERLAAGGCKVQTSYSLVDADVDSLFAQAAEQLREQLARSQAEKTVTPDEYDTPPAQE